MAVFASSSALRQLRFVVASWKEDARTDVELLLRFIQSRDEQAFTTLVGRHGEMVWRVCFRVLRNSEDAEDALQATFLRLARDASRIVKREALAGWLFHVARICAIEMRRSIMRQRRIEERLAAVVARGEDTKPATDPILLLEDEIAALSSTDRDVLVLVCMEGRTYADAALELGCSIAAVHRRLVRAQTHIRRRLARHGPISAVMLASGMLFGPVPAAPAAAPALLARSVESGVAIACGGDLRAGRAVTVALGAASGDFTNGFVVVGMLTIALTVGLIASPGGRTSEPQAAVKRSPAAVAESIPTSAARNVISGIIRDTVGRQVSGADVIALARRPFGPGERGLRDTVLASTTTDDSGRFALTLPESFATWFPSRIVTIQATSPGMAAATLPVRVEDSGRVELRLERGSELLGRLVGPSGEPAADVEVEVVRIGDAVAEPVLGGKRAVLPGWPAPVKTNARGEFSLPVVGGCENVWMRVTDPRFAFDTFRADSSGQRSVQEFRLDGAVPLDVEVRDANSDRPLVGARVTVITDRLRAHPHFCATDHAILGPHRVPADIEGLTDGTGHLRVGIAHGDRVEILVHPPHGDGPLLGVRTMVTACDERLSLNPVLRLPNGRWVSGRVIDSANRPLSDAVVHWSRVGATKPEWRDDVLVGRDALARTDQNGQFRVAVLPGECSLRVYGPTLGYTGFHARVPGTVNSTLFANAIKVFRVSPDQDIPPITVALERGQPVVGVVEHPSGDTSKTIVLCSGRVSPVRPYASLALSVRPNGFVIPGCRAGQMTRAYLIDPVARVGAIADLSPGSHAPQVKLAACGAISLRLLGASRLPQGGHDVNLSLLVERERFPTDEPVEDAQPVEWFDPVNYPARPRSDADGLVELRGLIPGARYSLSAGNGADRLSIGRFTVEPGVTLNLPDVILDEPGAVK